MAKAIRKLQTERHLINEQGTKARMGGEGSGDQALATGGGERFECPRCGYARSLKPGEDGFQLFVLHEKRCIPTMGRQLWFPFITEDDLNWSSWEKKGTLMFSVPIPVARTDRGLVGEWPPCSPVDSREAA